MAVGVILSVVSISFFLVSVLTLWWMLHAWRTPEVLHATRFGAADGAHSLSFSLLVPARHEEGVLQHTVERLLRSTHTKFEVLLIVGHDDPATTRVAEELARRAPERVRVIVDRHDVKNKPKALNTALPHCTGEIIGVFDAEDQVHPKLLEHVDHAFRSSGAQVVQGGVQLVNFQSSWYSLRNCLEYYFWFRSRLHLQAARGFIPLGGNTVFVRGESLRAAGGWDQDCLAEDCDLGVRLSSQGAKVVVAYDSHMVTREETPGSVAALLRQRTRWNQGFLQVFAKGDWKRLPSWRQRMLARYTLGSPFLQAANGVAFPLGALAAFLLDVPAGIALVTYLPVLPMLAALAFELAGLHDFGRQYNVRVAPVHYLKLAAGTLPYSLILAAAALRAVWRESRGHGNWELTSHVGAHLTDVTGPRTAIENAA